MPQVPELTTVPRVVDVEAKPPCPLGAAFRTGVLSCLPAQGAADCHVQVQSREGCRRPEPIKDKAEIEIISRNKANMIKWQSDEKTVN